MDWNDRPTLVTGGAACIGSALVTQLIQRGARVRVVDDLSNGRREYVQDHIDTGNLEFIEGDLLDQQVARASVDGINAVFHLAADHGGRGYVQTHQLAPATNMALDGMLFKAAKEAGVEHIVYASSGCIYPNYIQEDLTEELYLTEDKAGPPYDADNMYGWAKLMAEMTLKAYAEEGGMKTGSARYFTVYGPRATVSHAVIAMIARAYIRQAPYVIWGTGEQLRNWTHVDDIVEGTIKTMEHIADGSAVNIGTMERIRVIDAARTICEYLGYADVEFEPHPEMPTGPLNRIADNQLAAKLFDGWRPQTTFAAGVKRTADWFTSTYSTSEVEAQLAEALLGK